MNDTKKKFIEACKESDVHRIDELIQEGFPAYIYLNAIFEIIFETKSNSLFSYIENYIKTHHLNKITNGIFADRFINDINSYKILSLINDKHFDKKQMKLLFDEMTYVSNSVNHYLIGKIIEIDEPSYIFDIIKKKIMNSSGGSDLWRDNKYTFFANSAIYYCYYSKYFSMINKLTPEKKDIMLTETIKSQGKNVFCTMIWGNSLQLYEYSMKKFNEKPNKEHYKYSCYIDNYDFSMKILHELFPGFDETLTSKKLITRMRLTFKKQEINHAIYDSKIHEDQRLYQFNKLLYTKLYGGYAIEFVRQNYLQIYVNLYGYANTIREIDSIIKDMQVCSPNQKIHITGYCCDNLILVYYFISSYTTNIIPTCQLTNYYADESTKISAKRNYASYQRILDYFSNYNKVVYHPIVTSKILNKNVLRLIYQYAKF